MNGTNYTFPSSEQMQVSLLLNQLHVNFTKGERLTLRAFAVNSVGTSDPVSADVIVPCEPWMHMGYSTLAAEARVWLLSWLLHDR